MVLIMESIGTDHPDAIASAIVRPAAEMMEIEAMETMETMEAMEAGNNPNPAGISSSNMDGINNTDSDQPPCLSMQAFRFLNPFQKDPPLLLHQHLLLQDSLIR